MKKKKYPIVSLTKEELQQELKKKNSALGRMKKKTKTIEEAHAREAQIEEALERVRSKTIAMHNSQHVAETIVLYLMSW
jgi:hypothetical protein